MDWLCFTKNEMLVTASEQKTGNKIRRYMQCLLTGVGNKNNFTSAVQSPNNGGHPE